MELSGKEVVEEGEVLWAGGHPAVDDRSRGAGRCHQRQARPRGKTTATVPATTAINALTTLKTLRRSKCIDPRGRGVISLRPLPL
jgi:hypothetical protein